MNEQGQTICLNMIVKDEAHVIARCLESVRPLIDSWAIVDTGSRDGTQEIVRGLLADLPGELIERPWKDFAHNRNEALEHARGRADYVLTIDADEVVELDPDFRLPHLTADAYAIEVSYAGCVYQRRQLVRDALPWRYVGVLHEHLECELARGEELLRGVRTVPRHDGARARDPHTYLRDALLLEQALIEEPENTRYVFYLAQSYRDAGKFEEALARYRQRVEMGGWEEEIWYSLYQAAQLEERLGRPWGEAMEAYLAAHQFRPDRAEPLFRIGLHYAQLGQHDLALLFLAPAREIPPPGPDSLFVEQAVYDFLLGVEYAVSSFYVGDHEAAVAANNALVRGGRLPPEVHPHVVRNRRYSLDARHPRERESAVGRLRVVVPALDAGPELEETVESLLAQDDPDFEVLLVQRGDGAGADRPLPDDPRLLRVAEATPAASGTLPVEAAVERCAPEDVVVALPPGHALTGPETLAAVRSAFGDAGCELLHAPHRRADGRLGVAVPAASAAEHEAGCGVAEESLLGFRPGLCRRAGGEGGVSREGLWLAAGFAATRFEDEAMTRAAPSAAPRASVAGAAFGNGAGGERPETISCLMVTRDRLGLAMRAMRCFADQTYPERELVVVSEGEDWYRGALERYAETLGIERARFVRAEAGQSLGALRNITMEAASGPVLCQWDDDDCSHPDRLARQYEAMRREEADACFLTEHLQYLQREGILFWIDWTGEGTVEGEWQLFPGSVMMKRDDRFRYPESGPYCQRGEDSALVAQLHENAAVARIGGMGHLYLYHYHGRNTFSRDHHAQIASYAVSEELLRQRDEEIRGAIDCFGLPRPLAVMSKAGAAFFVE